VVRFLGSNLDFRTKFRFLSEISISEHISDFRRNRPSFLGNVFWEMFFLGYFRVLFILHELCLIWYFLRFCCNDRIFENIIFFIWCKFGEFNKMCVISFKFIISIKYYCQQSIYIILETCFPFLIHCWPIRARDVSHSKITKK